MGTDKVLGDHGCFSQFLVENVYGEFNCVQFGDSRWDGSIKNICDILKLDNMNGILFSLIVNISVKDINDVVVP